jgi:hypothetical protein
MKKRSSPSFDESALWIRKNPLATTHDVPDELLKTWSYKPEDDLGPASTYLSIFTFGYCQSQIRKTGGKLGGELSVNTNELVELFVRWQLKLAMVEVHRKTDVKVAALPLFDFPEHELITYWRS